MKTCAINGNRLSPNILESHFPNYMLQRVSLASNFCKSNEIMKTIHGRDSIENQKTPTPVASNTLEFNRNYIDLNNSQSPNFRCDSIHIRNHTIQEYDNLPSHLVKDNPKPAVLIARKLLSDFVELATKKIEAILVQGNKGRSIYKSLQRKEDPIYDQLLDAIGVISEFCLPSLLKLSISWYKQQLSLDEMSTKRSNSIIEGNNQSLAQQSGSLLSPQSLENQSFEHGSPCTEALVSIASTVRSPTPSSPDLSNQISIYSTLPLDYQSPSITVIGDLHSSAANTSTSTATNISSNSLTEDATKVNRRLELSKTRKILIEYTFCQLLIEIFNQLHLHPGHEELISLIEDIAFEHFKHTESSELNSYDIANVNQLADKFAEVIGVLAQTRFKSVRKRFTTELSELKAIKEPSPYNIQCIVALLSGIKFFRVKMAPIEDFEISFQFLQELADYFLEVRHKSVKHALANLFVEIMVPLASTVKNEVKIPCLKNFVDTLWSQTLDMCSRKKHTITLFPLVTCLLCVSQRSFFITNWGVFLNMCMTNLKNRDQKMCHIALESLYRLIWIYMIRVKCESNVVTQARLQSIVDALFPKGSRSVVPRDAQLTIFVDIIQFIAQERLDFAMRHIIFDLLSVDRPFKVIVSPERMNIALQAVLVIIDGLYQKEGDPSMPISVGSPVSLTSVCHNRNAQRRAHSGKMLNDDIAKSIGIYPYYNHIQRSFSDILKALDTQFGRPLLLTASHNNSSSSSKDLEDVKSGEKKAKMDLFKTCISAIPRLMPEGMTKSDLIELLSRMTIHVDEEVRKRAFESLRILTTEFVDWRLDVIENFTLFLANQIDESLRNLVDNALKLLLQLLISWRDVIMVGSSNSHQQQPSSNPKCNSVTIQTGYETISNRNSGTGGQVAARKNRALAEMRLIQSELNSIRFDRLVSVIQKVEGASFVMLCSCHLSTRKIAGHLLRESRNILKCYSSWICMEQLGSKSPDEADEEDLSASLRGSLSADNLSRITATSANGPAYSSVTSMNTHVAMSSSISKMHTASHHHLSHGHQQQTQEDPFNLEMEGSLPNCFNNEDNSALIFWTAVIMLESNNEQEYTFALGLLSKYLPNLPIEQPELLDDLERNLLLIDWDNFQGLQTLILKGCTSATNYNLSITLLDQLTPIVTHQICTGSQAPPSKLAGSQLASYSDCNFPIHVVALMTQLLLDYDDPTAFSMNIARRLAMWCDENSQRLENLSAVMSLYSRRCFSKDGFQWTKCVIKYLYDAYQQSLLQVVPLLVNMLDNGPVHLLRVIPPILYCILNYVDIGDAAGIQHPVWPASGLNIELAHLYRLLLLGGNATWRDATQIFKLIISRSSHLAHSNSFGRELPGRVLDFSLDVELMGAIDSSQPAGGLQAAAGGHQKRLWGPNQCLSPGQSSEQTERHQSSRRALWVVRGLRARLFRAAPEGAGQADGSTCLGANAQPRRSHSFPVTPNKPELFSFSWRLANDRASIAKLAANQQPQGLYEKESGSERESCKTGEPL